MIKKISYVTLLSSFSFILADHNQLDELPITIKEISVTPNNTKTTTDIASMHASDRTFMAYDHATRAQEYLQRAQYKEAMYEYVIALEYDSTISDFYCGLAFCHHENGNLTAAITVLQQGLSVLPNAPDIYRDMGVMLMEKKEHYPQALESFIIAYKLYDKQIHVGDNTIRASICNNIGAILTFQGKTTEALHWFEKAVSFDVEYAQGYVNLGNIYTLQRKFDLAIKTLEKAIELSPCSSVAHLNLGCALLEDSNYAGATKALEAAIMYDQNNQTAYFKLMRLHFEQGDETAAWQCWQKSKKALTMKKPCT